MAKDPIMEELCERFEAANKAYNDAGSKLEAYALPLIRKALKEGDERHARSIARALPSEALALVFAMDAFRQANVPWRAPVEAVPVEEN